jgi:hypothetical protein
MITATPEYLNTNRIKIYTASNAGHRIIGSTVTASVPESTTISLRPIMEIDEGVLPPDADLQTVRDMMISMAQQGHLTAEEINTLVEFTYRYNPGREYDVGDFFFHEGAIYEVIEPHRAGDSPDMESGYYKQLISLAEIS